MVNPNLMVVFGQTPDSYFVTYGRKMSYRDMPESLIKTFTTEPDMNPMNVAWLRMRPYSQTWAAMNMYNNNIWYDTSMSEELTSLVKGDNLGNKASSVSWTEDGTGYFVKLRPSKGWTADLPDEYPHKIEELRMQLKNFDIGLKTILFGHANTHIYVFERGFSAELNGPAEDADHPLHKILTEFSKPGWNLHESSSLSPYDSQYFCLKFQHEGSTTIEMRWNLPNPISERLTELRNIFNDPNEQAAVSRQESNVQRSELFNANLRFGIARRTNIALFGSR